MDEGEQLGARAQEVLEQSRALLGDARRQLASSKRTVSLQPRSANRKLAPQSVEIANSGRKRFVPIGPFVASTYVSIAATCPESCPFKEGGCFAKAGATHLTMGKLDRAAIGRTGLEVTLAEAAVIDRTCKRGVPQDGAKGGRDLRLHVGGEVSCTKGARALAAAAKRWSLRGGGTVWTFTHRWREIPRRAWGSISVMASCETEADIAEARARGYAPSIVIDDFPAGSKAFAIGDGRGIPCPAEAQPHAEARMQPGMRPGPTCARCRLCLRDRFIIDNGLVVVLRAHGSDGDEAGVAVREAQAAARSVEDQLVQLRARRGA